jgi:hypothetical protein
MASICTGDNTTRDRDNTVEVEYSVQRRVEQYSSPSVSRNAENPIGCILGVFKGLVPGIRGKAPVRAHYEMKTVFPIALDLQINHAILDGVAGVGWLGHLPGIGVTANWDDSDRFDFDANVHFTLKRMIMRTKLIFATLRAQPSIHRNSRPPLNEQRVLPKKIFMAKQKQLASVNPTKGSGAKKGFCSVERH